MHYIFPTSTVFLALLTLAACGGSEPPTATDPEPPKVEQGNSELNDFRTSPIERPDVSAAPPNAVGTQGEAYFFGEMQLDYIDYQRQNPTDPDQFYVERSYGDLTLRIRLGTGVVSGMVVDIRQENGTPRTGELAISSPQNAIYRDRYNFLEPETNPTQPEAVNFNANIDGELDTGTESYAQIGGSLRGVFLGQDGEIVAGEGGSAVFADDGFDDISFFFVSTRGEQPDQGGATDSLQLDLDRLSSLTGEFDDLTHAAATVSSLGTIPISGSANYSGIITIPVHNGQDLFGDVLLVADFSELDVAGTASGFVRSDGAVLDGDISVSDDSKIAGFTTFEAGRLFELFGTLTGAEHDYLVYLGGLGDFNGSNGELLDVDIVGYVRFDGEVFNVDDGSLIATR